MFCLLVFIILTIINLSHTTYFPDRPALYQLSTVSLELGECPFWDHRKNVLYFVDIRQGNLHTYHYTTNEFYSIHLNGRIGPTVPTQSNPDRLIVGLNTTIVQIEWDGKSDQFQQTSLLTLTREKEANSVNDGKADRQGRLWYGTKGYQTRDNSYLDPNQGTLYRITNDLKANPVIHPVDISNGLIWSLDNTKLYYTDSPTKKIMEYDYNTTDGSVRNQKVLFDFNENGIGGVPDGMTMDADGNLWIAVWDGGSVIQINTKTMKLMKRILIPARFVTSVMWGGPKFDILFVTTAKSPLTESERQQLPGSGHLYALTNLGTVGFPIYFADF